jgi:hypothetical protein
VSALLHYYGATVVHGMLGMSLAHTFRALLSEELLSQKKFNRTEPFAFIIIISP